MSFESKAKSASKASPSFVDTSTECAICFEPLDDGESSTSKKPVITLNCGHKWHRECIVQQIRVGSMTASNDDQRILFQGCQCGKCGRIFGPDDHPDELPTDLLRSTDKLRHKVHALMEEHNLLQDMGDNDTAKTDMDASREALYQEAMRKYAFYLCSHCQSPYFGGTIQCADNLPNSSEGPPEAKLCPACAPQSQHVICQHPTEHGRYWTWKCRYCCQPSTTVCYGNVHFCRECHARHSSGHPLQGIPCEGETCPYPKPPTTTTTGGRHTHHSNGASSDCEQVYFCGLCDSVGREASNNAHTNHALDPLAMEAGSRNFLVNPSGQDGLEGWRQLNPRMSWRVEGGEDRASQIIPPLLQTPVLPTTPNHNNDDNDTNNTNTNAQAPPPRAPITTNFVSSFLDCAMAQTVDMSKVLRLGSHNNNNATIPRVARIEVSARYTGRTDCPSVFALQAILSDGEPTRASQRRNHNSNVNNNTVTPQRPRISPPQRLSSGTLEAPPGVYWERTCLEFALDTTGNVWNRPMITVIVFGKDMRFWQGNFGSKVADITLRVVGGTPEELQALVKPPESLGDDGVGAENNNSSNDRKRTTPQGVMFAAVAFGVVLSWIFMGGS